MFLIAALYKFVHLPDYQQLQLPLKAKMQELGIKGSILLAEEGINGTISGEEATLRGFLAYLKQDERLADLVHKESWNASQPFKRTKVRLKKEAVTLGIPVDANRTGTYIEASDWNALISDPEVVLLDTRNDYEVEMGTFEGAVDPQIKKFRDLPKMVKSKLDPKQHKKVAMFCTGGIRCEKLSAWMLEQGFESVFQLKGGILKYLEAVPQEQSKWQGICFVFDEREAVTHGLRPIRNSSDPIT